MKLQALVLQHQHNAPPALLAGWAAQRELELVIVRADRERERPEPDGFGFAVPLGSDHSAGDDRPPWVERELATELRPAGLKQRALHPAQVNLTPGDKRAFFVGHLFQRDAKPE
jgi:hypothetical protein